MKLVESCAIATFDSSKPAACPLEAPARRAVNAIRMMATCDTCQVRDKETCAVCTTLHALDIADELEDALGQE